MRFILCLIAALSACPAHAVLYQSDWLAPGDGLLTFDSSTSREWLDLSETLLENFASPGMLLEEGYQLVVDQTSQGGIFEEFEVSGEMQATQLALSAGLTLNETEFVINGEPADQLLRLIGTTGTAPEPGRNLFSGLIDATGTIGALELQTRLAFDVSSEPEEGLFGRAVARVTDGYVVGSDLFPSGDSRFGVLLSRQAVPEPGAIAGMGLAFYCAFAVRRRGLGGG